MRTLLRKAIPEDAENIWVILRQAIARRKADGSNQWQDGYPNPEVIARDIEREIGYVLEYDARVIGYTAILINDEPEYAKIEGSWLTDQDFVVYHRVAISEEHAGQGFSYELLQHIEVYARKQGIYSLKADTNHDNGPMLRIFKKEGYTYCGKVYFRGSPRLAYEKVLT